MQFKSFFSLYEGFETIYTYCIVVSKFQSLCSFQSPPLAPSPPPAKPECPDPTGPPPIWACQSSRTHRPSWAFRPLLSLWLVGGSICPNSAVHTSSITGTQSLSAGKPSSSPCPCCSAACEAGLVQCSAPLHSGCKS